MMSNCGPLSIIILPKLCWDLIINFCWNGHGRWCVYDSFVPFWLFYTPLTEIKCFLHLSALVCNLQSHHQIYRPMFPCNQPLFPKCIGSITPFNLHQEGGSACRWREGFSHLKRPAVLLHVHRLLSKAWLFVYCDYCLKPPQGGLVQPLTRAI